MTPPRGILKKPTSTAEISESREAVGGGGAAASTEAPSTSSGSASYEQQITDALAKRDTAAFQPVYDRIGDRLFALVLSDGHVPITAAAAADCTPIVKALLDSGDTIDRRNKHGFTALHEATAKNNVRMLQYLIETGRASLDARNPYNRDALMIAARAGHADAVCYLLTVGMRPTNTDNGKETALDLARRFGYDAIVHDMHAALEHDERARRSSAPRERDRHHDDSRYDDRHDSHRDSRYDDRHRSDRHHDDRSHHPTHATHYYDDTRGHDRRRDHYDDRYEGGSASSSRPSRSHHDPRTY